MAEILNATLATVTAAAAAATATDDMSEFTFTVFDYIVFIFMLMLSAGIGVYFGFFANKNQSTDDYLLGGRQMRPIPIAISLVTSQSGISFMSMPAEIYAYGLNGAFLAAAMLVVMPILNKIVIPIFYENQISNCYQYLELRFDARTKKLLATTFVITSFLLLPIFMFIPALAFSQVTGINIHLINAVVCSICIFYTMLGGIKAGVWADVIQASLMALTVVLLAVLGAKKVGGLGRVLSIASEGRRLDVDFTLDHHTRATFWNCFIGSIVVWTSYIGLNQGSVQRIVSMPTLKDAQKAIKWFSYGFLLVMFFNCFTGVVMYARYHDCDPITAGLVQKADKLMPFFVQDILGDLNGMPGVFISCVFSAALSTLSAGLNSLSGVVYFGYIKPFIRHTEQRASFIMKSFVVGTGIYCIIAGLIVEKSNSILQMIYAIGGLTYGAIFGVFFLGMLVPKAHSKAAFWSVVASLCATMVIFIGSSGLIRYRPYPGSLHGCPSSNITTTTTISTTAATLVDLTTAAIIETPKQGGFDIFKLSFNWYVLLGAAVVFLVGIPMSYYVQPDSEEPADPKLFASFVQSWMKYKRKTTTEELPEIIEEKEALSLTTENGKNEKD